MFLIKKLETKFTREEKKKINDTKLIKLFSACCKNPQREREEGYQATGKYCHLLPVRALQHMLTSNLDVQCFSFVLLMT